MYERIQPGDEDAVKTERQRLGAESESRISERVSKIYGERFDPELLSGATRETDLDMAFDRRAAVHRDRLHTLNRNTYRSQHTKEDSVL